MIPFKEFKDQYCNEHIDDKTSAEHDQDNLQLLVNIRLVKSYDETTHDIMKFAQYYCFKYCLRHMNCVHKLDHDINKVFKNVNNTFPGINKNISIRATG